MRKIRLKGKNNNVVRHLSIGIVTNLKSAYNSTLANNCWDKMDCLFCKIAAGDIPATILHEDSEIMVFRDIQPQAPTHLLIIPKKHIATINDADTNDEQVIGRMILTAKKMAAVEGLSESGYRLVFNVNQGGGQAVYHIHLHLLGGRQMTWPPG
jgi:histidine triad (HIT) family protein